MVDIRLISVLTPSQPVQGVGQPPTTQGGTPGILINLPVGSVLSGFIINRDPAGNPILRTETADIVFSSNFFLKIGSEVVIRIENRSGQNQARILSVNGQPPEVAEGQSAFSQDPDVIVGQNQSAPPRAAVQTADTIVARTPLPATLSGTVIPVAQPSSAATNPLPAGTRLTLRVASFTPPAADAPASGAATPSYAVYGRPPTAVPAGAAPPSATGVTTASAATSPIAAPATVTSPGTATPSVVNTLAPGAPLVATFIGNEPSGEALLQTSAGAVRLSTNLNLLPGSKLRLEVATLNPPGTSAAIAPTRLLTPAPLTELAQEWASLKQIVSLLSEHNRSPDAILQLPIPSLLTASPNQPSGFPAPPQITAGLLLFVSALRGGDFRSWLGRDSADWLSRSGHESLLKKAEGEFGTIARMFFEPPPSSWQSLFFPFAVAGELHQVRLFTKRDRKKDRPDAKNTQQTRFIVEVDLSQLGEMQIDGFVRRQEKAVEFDLVIRSLQPLDQQSQNDILAIYHQTGELTGYQGSLQFQAVREFPVHPMEELAGGHRGDVIA